MFTLRYLVALLPLAVRFAAADGVSGSPSGFGTGTTGGGNATPQYPADIKQLESWLADDVARTIILNKEYNFIGSQGKVTENGCRPASNTCGSSGQDAINKANWCTNGNAGAGSYTIKVTYDKAATNPLYVGPNKSIVGISDRGVIRGRGLYIKNTQNVIVQNVHITELNPQYIWGGDAIAVDNADLVWLDHNKFSLIGRQMVVLGTGSSQRVTISANEFDGSTSWSATCDGRHYWTLYLTGSQDLVTLKGNYIHHTSGRSPKVAGNTLLHAVNNYFYSNSGHAFDVDGANNVVIEGCVFQNVNKPLNTGSGGQIFASPDTTTNRACITNLHHTCQLNQFGSSGSLPGDNQAALTNFQGKTVAAASAPNAQNIQDYAGVGVVS